MVRQPEHVIAVEVQFHEGKIKTETWYFAKCSCERWTSSIVPKRSKAVALGEEHVKDASA